MHVGERFPSGGQPPGHEVICARASAKRIKSGRRRHLQLWRARPTISPVARSDVIRAGQLRTGQTPNFGELEVVSYSTQMRVVTEALLGLPQLSFLTRVLLVSCLQHSGQKADED
ncbi:hypothetical protein Bbelb_341700 [Branchiostoma belcheri]|nr:hypothetical protein Bbelb_341700 [Branchiostoma belcheri]